MKTTFKPSSGALLSRRRFNLGMMGAAAALAAPPVLAQTKPTELKLASVVPLTGPSSAYGIRTRDGALMARDHYNASELLIAGKPYTVRVDAADMANDARQAITLVRQYSSDPSYLAVLGLTNSVGYVASVPVARQLKMPVVGGGSSAPIKQWNPYAYRVNPVSEAAIPVLVKTVVAAEKIKRLAVIYDQTQDAQLADAEICKNIAGESGYEIVAYQSFRTGDQDFSPQIATIRNAKPDGIFLAAATGDGVKVLSQIRGAGIKVPLMTGFGSFLDTVYWDGTNGQTAGGYTWLTHDLMSPKGELKGFIEEYNKRFTQEATSFSAYGFDTVAVAVEAAKAAGALDREKLQNALSKLDITTPIGTRIKFENPPTGNNLEPTMIVIRITGRGSYEII